MLPVIFWWEEEEIFAAFTVEEIEQLWEQHKQKEVLFVREENNSSSDNGDLEVEEIDNPSDVDVFVDEEEGKEYNSDQSSEEEEATNTAHCRDVDNSRKPGKLPGWERNFSGCKAPLLSPKCF